MTRTDERLLIIALCILFIVALSACAEPSGSSASTSKPIEGMIPIIDEEPPDDPEAPPVDDPDPEPWTAPANAASVMAALSGTYVDTLDPTDILDFSTESVGYITTTYTRMVGTIPVPTDTVCEWTGHSLHAEDRLDGSWNIWMTLSSYTHTADTTVRDCMKQPTQAGITEVAMFVRFIDENCIGVYLKSYTTEKTFCKESP